MRFVLFLAVMNMFFLTTNPDDFALTLEKLHMPLTVSLSFMLALRFIPTMANQVTEIIEAQLSRGLKLDRGGFLTRIKNFLPILIPLIILSIKRSIEVAESLEIRGVYPGVKKTSYVTLKTTKNDYIFIFLNITVVLIIYILSIHYPTILTQYMVLL
jgi:energy-coupling factor transport system permease protein